MRAERNGKESAKKGAKRRRRNEENVYVYEKRWMSFIEKERRTYTQGTKDRQSERKWNKMLMAKSDAGNELNERHKSQ